MTGYVWPIGAMQHEFISMQPHSILPQISCLFVKGKKSRKSISTRVIWFGLDMPRGQFNLQIQPPKCPESGGREWGQS